MTKDEALTMIIASIAMEELALSHILNAESEKLQYILGTLPEGQTSCASPQEVLAVNKSVTELLDTVIQSQMLLKGKMEKALEAGGRGPAPEPSGPCGSGTCGRRSGLHLVSRCSGFSWDDGFLLSWKCREQRGCAIRQNEKNPALVDLDPGKVYGLEYTVNVRGPYHGDSAGAVLVRLTPCEAFSDVLPLYFSVKDLECEPLTLHYSAALFPTAHSAPCAGLSLLLDYEGSLFVEQASLSIYEL